MGRSLGNLRSAAISLGRHVLQLTRRSASQRIFFTNRKPEYAAYEIGEWTYGSPTVLNFGDGGTLKIGRFCSISGGGHQLFGWLSYLSSSDYPLIP